ncbi:hypothetical protein AMTR_s00063p00212140 [Amborella trichopoda]|uniref:Uncharacterized protein n=1 Tax=Amborella trichopoda TaxID=13333 RepID=U5CST2_AMBTC|nr:hypothetical protein AMTR_s00063p00212140 [Amborella trichopoda]
MHESTLAPSSQNRMSSDPCLKEFGPMPLQGQRDMHETDKGLEQHEGAAPGIVGDKDPSVVEGKEFILSEQHVGIVEGEGDAGLSTSVGGGPNADEIPEQHEAVAPEAA